MHHLFYQSVLAVEADSLRIMAVEEVKGMHHRVLVAKEPVHTPLLVGIDRRKAAGGDIGILLDQSLGHHHLLHAVSTWILKHLFAHHVALLHGLPHLQCGVDQYAVIAVQHLGIHTAHRGADDEVGVLPTSHFLQHRHRLDRVQRNVVRHHRRIG